MASFPGNPARLRSVLALCALAAWTAAPGTAASAAAPPQCVWDGIERVVAVGDVHGDLDAFVTILQDKGLIDEDQKWIGGKSHLVQLGDVMDRGDRARDILVLIAGLEKEAEEAGGMVHFIPGNHEEMNLAGVSLDYEGYVTIQQFRDFLPPAYRDRHDRLTARMNGVDARAYWEALMKEERAKAVYYEEFRRTVGRWIAAHNVIIKINGVVLVHGGISIADSRRALESINARYGAEFRQAIDETLETPQYLFQPAAPLWNRDLGDVSSSIIESDVKQILANLKARAIVVGHTPTPGDEARRFGGLVWVIDSRISSYYREGSRFSALEIDKNGNITFGWESRHAPKKLLICRRLLPRAPGMLFLCGRLSPAPGHA